MIGKCAPLSAISPSAVAVCFALLPSPLLIIGACIGSIASRVLPGPDPALWATVGMAAMLGGTIQAPFTSTVFALETTWAWTDTPMIFAAGMTAVAVTIAAVRRSILTEKIARRGTHVAREYGVHPLEGIALAEVMVPRERVTTLSLEEPLAELGARLATMPPPYRHLAYPVIDGRGAVVGVVEHAEIVARAAYGEGMRLAEIMRPPLMVHVERRLSGAVERMATTGRRIVIVVGEKGEWIGLLAHGDILRAWRRVVHHERRRVRIRTVPWFEKKVREAGRVSGADS